MPVEIRELIISTRIISREDSAREGISPERLALLKKNIVQECLRALKDKPARHHFDR